jgi:hypothetical protein
MYHPDVADMYRNQYQNQQWETPSAYETAAPRHPRSSTEYVRDLFRGQRNVRYLEQLMRANAKSQQEADFYKSNMERAAMEFEDPEDQPDLQVEGGSLITSYAEPHLRGAISYGSELKRLNYAFFKQMQARAALYNESRQMHYMGDQLHQMLYPKGLEHLNGHTKPDGSVTFDVRLNASAEERDSRENSEAEMQAQLLGCKTVNYPHPPRRYNRYEGIPRWQHTARALDGLERDIDETLGAGSLEMDSQARRWDMRTSTIRHS